MRILLYDYVLPYRSLFSSNTKKIKVDRFQDFELFYEAWSVDEEAIIVIPLHTFNIIGLDIRSYFHRFGPNDKKRFILIGDKRQIEFCLSQNEFFLRNDIYDIQLPTPIAIIEDIIKLKMDI